jgi:leucyl-tRNA synthetase
VVFDLIDQEKVEISQEEKDSHDIVWLNESQLNYENMTHAEISHWKEKMQSKYAAYQGEGVLINSGKFDGLTTEIAKKEITQFVNGQMVTKFKLRDWVFSRQHYWGEPIPMVFCDGCGWVPVPEKELPIKLPKVKKYQPTDTGESPLAAMTSWVNVVCPICKGPAKRETDTMPNWAGSNWYYLRYTDPHNTKELAAKKSFRLLDAGRLV